MGDNWIVGILNKTLNGWNDKLAEVWALLTVSPETFKGGEIWTVIEGVNGAMQGIGYALLVLFFAINIFKSSVSFRDFKRPEYALRQFIYFALAKTAITYGMELIMKIFAICNGIVAMAASGIGGPSGTSVALPREIAQGIENAGFLDTILLFAVALIGMLLITVLSYVIILTVYGRFFKLYMYAALSPVAFASFAGEGTTRYGKAFLRSYIGVCLEGVVIVLACLIFSAFAGSGAPAVDPDAAVITQVWSYLGEVIFNMLVLVGIVKGADHIAKEMFGL